MEKPTSAVCDLNTFLEHKYDFVICGGGTAGLAIAARLSENPNIQVGVLEAGADRRGDPTIDIPALFLSMYANPDYDWHFETTAQEGNRGIRHHIPRGKVLGGSSAINYMMYVRGDDKDYDDWAQIVGDESWSSKHMKQYMMKHQTLEPFDANIKDRSTMHVVSESHGFSGPIKTSFNDSALEINNIMIKAAEEATGLKSQPNDPYSGNHLGFTSILGTVSRSGSDKGKRSYSARGYLDMADKRPNLKVLCDAMVAHIDLDGNTAKGVTFLHGGAKHSIPVTREVIVCAGAIQSPQILELSGIGDPKVLKAAGVECKVELPSVGTNFQDHLLAGVGYELAPGLPTLDAVHIPPVIAEFQKILMETQGGPLTNVASCQGFFPANTFLSDEEVRETVESIKKTANESTPFQKKQLERVIARLEDPTSPSLQLVLVPATCNFESGVQNQSILFPPPAEPGKTMGVTLGIGLQYPVSRGTIHIASSDPSVHPTIDPQFLKHSADVAVLGAALKFADTACTSKASNNVFAKRSYPDPQIDLQQTAQSRKAAQDWVLSEYHPCGTCAMGDVVDSHLRVKGVKGLRVADASIFPNQISGNICATVYSIAEKAADIVKGDWL